MLQYYSKGADVLNELPATSPDRSKDGFEGEDEDEDENGDSILW
jgi:hypothetical protein